MRRLRTVGVPGIDDIDGARKSNSSVKPSTAASRVILVSGSQGHTTEKTHQEARSHAESAEAGTNHAPRNTSIRTWVGRDKLGEHCAQPLWVQV
jgi:hypothetical protein